MKKERLILRKRKKKNGLARTTMKIMIQLVFTGQVFTWNNTASLVEDIDKTTVKKKNITFF